jgi:hypothetical protein
MLKSFASQTIVASSVFLDLVGFSKLSTSAQVQAKDRFNDTLRHGLAELGSEHYWVRDLGDGALIICPHSPEHALFVALEVHQEFATFSVVPGQPVLALRIGLNLGVLKTNPDLEGRPNYLGDGINATQRVMDFAQPGQILASRAFVDAIALLHTDYATMFVVPQSLQDKHGRTHEVYSVEPAPITLERLLVELTVKQYPTSCPAEGALVPHPASAPETDFFEHAITIIRNWFIPFNALLFTVGVVWTGFQRFGLSSRIAVLSGLALGILGLAVWWLAKRKSGKFAAVGGLLTAFGCMVGATGWISSGAKEEQAKSLAPQATAASAVAPLVAAPTSTPAPLAIAVLPVATAPDKIVALPVKKRDIPVSASPKTVKPVAPNESSGAERARCTVLLNKSALGEFISAADKQELMQSCR